MRKTVSGPLHPAFCSPPPPQAISLINSVRDSQHSPRRTPQKNGSLREGDPREAFALLYVPPPLPRCRQMSETGFTTTTTTTIAHHQRYFKYPGPWEKGFYAPQLLMQETLQQAVQISNESAPPLPMNVSLPNKIREE